MNVDIRPRNRDKKIGYFTGRNVLILKYVVLTKVSFVIRNVEKEKSQFA